MMVMMMMMMMVMINDRVSMMMIRMVLFRISEHYNQTTYHLAKYLETHCDLRWVCDDDDDDDGGDDDDGDNDDLDEDYDIDALNKTWRFPFKQGHSSTLSAYQGLAPSILNLLLIIWGQ